MFALILLVLANFNALSEAAFCSGAPSGGEYTNDNAVVMDSLKYIKKVKNGVLYEAGPENARFPVVHVYGSSYDMGYAQGELMGEYLSGFVHGVFEYIQDSVIDDSKFPHIPKKLKQLILEKGINTALDWNLKETSPFIPQSYNDEIQGISDALPSVTKDLLNRLQMFPEITKASCSFFGSWSSASKDGKTYHMRSLDYDTEGPFLDFPQVTIYHPSDGNSFASVGWPATLGALTGMNDQQMGINEIGVSFPDDSFGQGTPDTPPEKVKGKPWMYVVRDILQHSSTLAEGLQGVEQSDRTCNLILGISDGKSSTTPESADAGSTTPAVYGIEYSGYVSNPYTDRNQLPVNETWHPKIENMVYNGMDWDCPTFTSVLGTQLQKYHGKVGTYRGLLHPLLSL